MTEDTKPPQKNAGARAGAKAPAQKDGAAKKGGWIRDDSGPAKGNWPRQNGPAKQGSAGKGGGARGGAQGPGKGNPGGGPALNRPAQARQGGPQGNRGAPGARTGQTVAADVVTVMPIAAPAGMKRRHWGLLASFLLMVVVPLAAVIFYLWDIAEDQYVSTTGFTVRQEEKGSASDLMGGLARFAGAGAQSDGDILYEFIQSQRMVEAVNSRIDLRAHYSLYWPRDWVFSLWPDATLEDLLWYWQRVVRLSYDAKSGLMELQVMAFAPDVAQQIGLEIVRESQDMINALNVQAREDAMRYAREDLEEAVRRLKAAREALTQFRTRTKIVDPAADIQSRMGVMANLQQQLAEALIEYDLLQETVSANDPRVAKAQHKIDVIRDRIAAERQTFTSDSTETGAVGEDYPTLIAEFESLSVDLTVAEETYRAALTALDVARSNAARQSRYLATYIPPTRPQTSEYPRRLMLSGLTALVLILVWSILALIYYSIRDRN